MYESASSECFCLASSLTISSDFFRNHHATKTSPACVHAVSYLHLEIWGFNKNDTLVITLLPAIQLFVSTSSQYLSILLLKSSSILCLLLGWMYPFGCGFVDFMLRYFYVEKEMGCVDVFYVVKIMKLHVQQKVMAVKWQALKVRLWKCFTLPIHRNLIGI